jgi:hypothetical protein
MRRLVSVMFKEVLLVVRDTTEFTFHTNPNAATIAGKSTGSQSTDEGRPGTRLPCRRYSTRSRTCKTMYLPYVGTSRRAGSGCAARMAQGFSLGRLLDPKQRTIWQSHSRVQTPGYQNSRFFPCGTLDWNSRPLATPLHAVIDGDLDLAHKNLDLQYGILTLASALFAFRTAATSVSVRYIWTDRICEALATSTHLHQSFVMMDGEIGKSKLDHLMDSVKGPYAGDNRLEVLNSALWHISDHHGRPVEYFRMNGMVPPASR